jgi:hypothetical protein
MKKYLLSITMACAAMGLFTACEDVPEAYHIKEAEAEQGVYINETFASSLGDFTVVNEVADGYAWKNDYSTAYISGYQNKENKASKTWLISPAMNLSEADSVFVSFEYVLRYKRATTSEKVLVSTNFDGTNPATATWTDLNVKLTEGVDYTTFYSAQADLPASVLGQENVVIALFYEAPATEASTWEVRNFVVKDGKAQTQSGGGEVTPTDNSREKPYTVSEAIANQSGKAWVKGYVVGYVSGQVLADGATFGAGGDVKTNILIAESVSETDYKNCLVVQLPVGTVRDGVNLVDNAGNLKKEILLYGSLEKYFGTAGMKSTSYAEIEGKKLGTDPDSTPTTSGIFSAAMTDGDGGFTVDNKTMPSELTYVWSNGSQYGWKASAFLNNTKYTTESWLISPAIKLPSGDSYLTFDHVMRYGEKQQLSLLVSTDKSSWTTLTIPTWSTGADWTFVNAGKISLSNFAGKTIYVAFKYTSNSSLAATWEIKNFLVDAGKSDETGGGETPSTTAGTYESPFSVAQTLAAYKDGDKLTSYVKGYIVGYINGNKYDATTAVFGVPEQKDGATEETEILIADSPSEKDYTKCVPVQLPAGVIRTGLGLLANPTNLGKQVLLLGSIERYFNQCGLKTVVYAEINGKSIGSK